MPEREKVMAALKCVAELETELTAECREKGCPYTGLDCERAVAADALAMLKEQKPRVMTKEEVITTPEGTVVWMEEEKEVESGTYIQPIVSTGNGCLGNFYIGVGTYGVEIEERRFWTSRPTPEQMRDTPWEEMP